MTVLENSVVLLLPTTLRSPQSASSYYSTTGGYDRYIKWHEVALQRGTCVDAFGNKKEKPADKIFDYRSSADHAGAQLLGMARPWWQNTDAQLLGMAPMAADRGEKGANNEVPSPGLSGTVRPEGDEAAWAHPGGAAPGAAQSSVRSGPPGSTPGAPGVGGSSAGGPAGKLKLQLRMPKKN